MKNIFITLLFSLTIGVIFSQNNHEYKLIPESPKKVILIQPTGEIINDLPEMIILEDTARIYKKVMENIRNSFINDVLDFYYIAQTYLRNIRKIDSIEPAYLAITQNMGGYAKYGFILKQNDKHIMKDKSAYVDIIEGQATGNINKLMSFSQLYPHELGHVLFHLISNEDTLESNSRSVDMHYYSIVTDYSNAFNEGFAEHMENVSRFYEKNISIKAGIKEDTYNIEKSSLKSIEGFEKDLNYFFRIGYYKASILNWYQKYEDYKRYVQSFNGNIRYKSKKINISDIEDQLTYRNTCVQINKNETRNLVQTLSTEGVVSSFFTHLSTTDLSNQYIDISFYKEFMNEKDTTIQSPQELFSPLQNQFIKYFFVFHHFVQPNNSAGSQLTDFIEGYIQTFPSEENKIKKIFKEVTGLEYTNKLPSPLWLMVKNYTHRLLVIDPFGSITVPVYTFDLNAAETEDLQTINGITREDAEKIVNYRNNYGFFSDFEQLRKIPDLTPDIIDKIISAKFDNTCFENELKNFEPELSMSKLIFKPLLYIFSRSGIYFIFIFGIIYFFLVRKEKPTIKRTIGLFIKYLLLWVFFVLSGLALVFMFKQSYIYFIILTLLISLFPLIIYRKRKQKLIRSLLFIGLTGIVILISIL